MRRIAAKRSVQRAAGWAFAIVLGAFLVVYPEIKHPPTALFVLRFVLGAIGLIALVGLVIDTARVARDWLWNRREDWRDWRNRKQRAHHDPRST